MRRRPLLIVLLAVAQVLVLLSGVGLAARRFATAPFEHDGMYVLLLLGSDQGPPRSGSVLQGRADGFHVLVVPADRSQATILSFPRDTYVPVPGVGRTKINAALTRGPGTVVATVEAVTGLAVDDWVVTGFGGLANAIDELGGLTVDVEQRLRDPFSGSNFQKGVQRLDGGQVLAYSRDRKSRPNGDFGRSMGQANVLRSLHRQLVGDGLSPTRVIGLAATFRRYTVSSLSAERLFQLGGLAASMDPDSVTSVLVPGRVGVAGAASVVRLTAEAERLFADLRDDGKLAPRLT